jgi:hypothetical protein
MIEWTASGGKSAEIGVDPSAPLGTGSADESSLWSSWLRRAVASRVRGNDRGVGFRLSLVLVDLAGAAIVRILCTDSQPALIFAFWGIPRHEIEGQYDDCRGLSGVVAAAGGL